MQLYANPDKPDHAANNARFLDIVKAYPQLSLFQPSPDKAPWHWQAIIDMGCEPQILNFWPHTMKGQRDGYKAVQGEHAIRGIIEQAIIDAGQDDNFDLFEG
jgi:hypothetical protein